MGTPAVLRIYSDDHAGAFVSQWASPERVIPLFAQWIEMCRTARVIPTATTYRDFATDTATATEDAGDLFQAGYPTGQPDPDGTQYRYEFRVGAYGNGWIADLTVSRAHARPDREPLMTVWHQVQFSDVDTSPMHLLAYRGIAHIIKGVQALNRPQHTAPALQEWAEAAAWHRTLAGAA